MWVWLPGQAEPVVAGRLDDVGAVTTFTYGRSYLARGDAIALYLPELPLRRGTQVPAHRAVHGCVSDAGPDAWGRRVIDRRRADRAVTRDASELEYLLEAGSDGVGALCVQASATVFEPRLGGPVGLEDLLRAAETVDEGRPLPPDLDRALLHGTSVGGAQPKATIVHCDRHLIAKFTASADRLPTVKAEHLAMSLARAAGLDVATIDISEALGRPVLLVERFDRAGDGTRRAMVSARTILDLGEMGIGASYAHLADVIRARFVRPDATLRELFGRITFNVLVGNTDDHARNHAAFWDGRNLELTPAYDIVPQLRGGEEAAQAMAIGADGARASRLSVCVAHAATYHLSAAEARAIIDRQLDVIHTGWAEACDAAGLSEVERTSLWGRQVCNPYALQGV